MIPGAERPRFHDTRPVRYPRLTGSIRASLERNPALRQKARYDWSAIELAVRERVSGTGDKTRGIGLYGVSEDMRVPGRQLIIHSGIGSLRLSEDVQSEARRTAMFPGTLAYASLPT